MDFIHRNLDKKKVKPSLVLTGIVDFFKAFKWIDHNVIVTILSDLNIPTCALRLIITYLSGRKISATIELSLVDVVDLKVDSLLSYSLTS